jgi:hypothetical protein
MEGWFTAEPQIAAAALAGRLAELRVPQASPLARLAPGARIAMREACIPGRHGAAGEVTTALASAQFLCFPDGERRAPDGTRWQGTPPRDAEEQWVAALHMPAWASRARFVVTAARTERLQAVGRMGLRASGFGGLLARRGFARHWDATHPIEGLRWRDDPVVVVLALGLIEAGAPLA